MDSALIQAIFNTSTGCGISNTTTVQSLETSDCNMHQTVFIICHSIQIPFSISPPPPPFSPPLSLSIQGCPPVNSSGSPECSNQLPPVDTHHHLSPRGSAAAAWNSIRRGGRRHRVTRETASTHPAITGRRTDSAQHCQQRRGRRGRQQC